MPARIAVIAGLLFIALPLSAASGGDWVQYSQMIFSLIILLLTLLVGGLALKWNFENNHRGQLSFLQYALRQPLVRVVLFVLAIILGLNAFAPNPYSDNPYENIAFARARHLPMVAAESYQSLTDRFPYKSDYHYQYVSAYYERGDWNQQGGYNTHGNPNLSPVFYYHRMLLHERAPGMSDLAKLGLAMAEYYEFMRQTAMINLVLIRDNSLPYVNYFKARIYQDWKQPDSADHYYRKEIQMNGAVQPAVEGFSRLVMTYDRDNLELIRSMLDNERIGQYVPQYMRKYLYVREATLGPYFGTVLKGWAENINLVGFLGALLGLAVWVMFLRRVDIFKKESWASMIGMVALGGLFTFAALPISDFVTYELGFVMTGAFWHDLFYCIAGIGLVEEFVKILPFLLVMQFTNLLRGPMSYIVYASLGALGFAFVENLMYFDDGNVGIIHGRVLVSVVGHMFDTSTVAFGLVLAKYRFGGRYTVPLFLGFFLLASIFHGLYDFWLINQAANAFYFFAYVIFIYATFQYAAYINNCLNNSPIFRGRTQLNTGKLAEFLLIALVGVLLFEYVALSLIYGPSVGNFALAKSMGMGSFLVFFVVLNLSYIDVVQGEWFPIRLWNFENRVDYNRSIGQKLSLVSKGPESLLHSTLPLSGEIMARVKLKRDNKYFLFALDQPLDILGHEVPYVLLKAREKNAVIEPGYGLEVAVVVFRDRHALERRRKRRSDFKLLDYVLVK